MKIQLTIKFRTCIDTAYFNNHIFTLPDAPIKISYKGYSDSSVKIIWKEKNITNTEKAIEKYRLMIIDIIKKQKYDILSYSIKRKWF